MLRRPTWFHPGSPYQPPEKTRISAGFFRVRLSRMYARFTLLFLAVLFTLFTLSLYVVGLEQSLFWKFHWYDTALHFLGGVSAGLGAAWFFSTLRQHKFFLLGLLGVFAVGVAWEIFEVVVGFPRETNYAVDTTTDIVMDMIGGVLSLCVARFIVRS